MANYFEAINNGNSTLLGDNYSNYALWKKGTVAVGSSLGIPRQALVDVGAVASGSVPIIAIVHDGQINSLVTNQSPDGGWRTVFLLSEFDTSVGKLVEWFAFLPSTAVEVTLNQTGLFCLWDEQGRPIYDSDAGFLRVVDFVSAKYPTTINRTYPSGRKYAIVVCLNQLYRYPGNSPGGWGNIAGMCAKILPDGRAIYSYQRIRWSEFGGEVQIYDGLNDTATFMVLDVTNI